MALCGGGIVHRRRLLLWRPLERAEITDLALPIVVVIDDDGEVEHRRKHRTEVGLG
jgi:hypothetical protein